MGLATLVRQLDAAGLQGLLQGKALKYVRSPPAAASLSRPELTVRQYIKGQQAITAYREISDYKG